MKTAAYEDEACRNRNCCHVSVNVSVHSVRNTMVANQPATSPDVKTCRSQFIFCCLAREIGLGGRKRWPSAVCLEGTKKLEDRAGLDVIAAPTLQLPDHVLA